MPQGGADPQGVGIAEWATCQAILPWNTRQPLESEVLPSGCHRQIGNREVISVPFLKIVGEFNRRELTRGRPGEDTLPIGRDERGIRREAFGEGACRLLLGKKVRLSGLWV